MPDDDIRVLLQLQPLSVSFPPKTFSLRPTVKTRIDLVGSACSTNSASRPDNGVFPSRALDQNPAQIVFHGSYFSLKTSISNSNNIRVNGYLLEDYTHTLRDGDRIEFGRASYLRSDEEYDSDGDYQSWPVYSFAPDVSIKCNLTFPSRFDSRRVWTDPFGTPVVYTPPTSKTPSSIKPNIPRSHTSSKPQAPLVPKSARVQDLVPLSSKPEALLPPASPPKGPIAAQLDSMPVSHAAAPHGTNWAGIAKLIKELHVAAPLPRTASKRSAPPISDPAPVAPARRAFCYGDFVGSRSSGAAAPHGHTGASATEDEDTTTPASVESPSMAVVSDLSATPSNSRLTSVSTSVPTSVPNSVLAPDQLDGLRDPLPQREKNAHVLLLSANTALERVGTAWMLARRAAQTLGATSAELAVARMGAAWRRARDALDATALPLLLSNDRCGSIPSSGSVVTSRLARMNGGIERDPEPAVSDPNNVCTPRPHSSVPAFTDSRSPGPPTASSSYPWLFPFPSPPQPQHHPAANAFMPSVSWPWIWPPYLALCHRIGQHAQLLFPSLYSYLPALPPIHFR